MMTNIGASEKYRQQSGHHEGPCLGPRTRMMIGFIASLQLGLAHFAASEAELAISLRSANWFTWWWIAAMWAGWACSLWVMVRQPLSVLRVVALAGLLAWHCVVLAVVRGMPVERYLLTFGCFGLLHSALATLGVFPNWRGWQQWVAVAQHRRQFNILAIVAMTTVVAAGLAAARQYRPAVEESFLPGTLLIGVVMSLVSVCGARLGSGNSASLLGGMMVTLVALVAAAIASVAEQLTKGLSLEHTLPLYGMCICVFGWLVWAFARCGRADSAQQLRLHENAAQES